MDYYEPTGKRPVGLMGLWGGAKQKGKTKR